MEEGGDPLRERCRDEVVKQRGTQDHNERPPEALAQRPNLPHNVNHHEAQKKSGEDEEDALGPVRRAPAEQQSALSFEQGS